MQFKHCESVVINADGVVLRTDDWGTDETLLWVRPLYTCTITYNSEAHRRALIAKHQARITHNELAECWYTVKAWLLSRL